MPRGAGLVTRCPLELQLVNIPRSSAGAGEDALGGGGGGAGASSGGDEYAEFAHLDGRRRFVNFDEVRAEIVRQMDRLAGQHKGIVRHPIGLTIYSHRVPNLFLVDLPGMVKVRTLAAVGAGGARRKSGERKGEEEQLLHRFCQVSPRTQRD